MKGLALAVLALCAASAGARTVILGATAAFHTDAWCADHHLGSGPSTCIQHSGCCYDGRIGQCHSCDAHSDEWCGEFGGDSVDTCIGYAGCTFDYGDDADGSCVSNSDPSSIVDEVTCEEALIKAQEEGGIAALTFGDGAVDDNADNGALIKFMPTCDEFGMWEPEQYDEASDFNWCVDDNGHEIPDTRKQSGPFREARINCDKERKQHAGMQCPNAVTLSAASGEVMINDNEDVGNCDVSCNTDLDCRGDEWCCYNGCGYSCQVPIIPKADCQHLILDNSLKVSDSMGISHGTEVTISCNDGYFGEDPVEIECKHGSWTDYDMQCMKDCEKYRVPAPGRQRDYEIGGNGNHHGDTRKIKCVRGYGAVAGSPDALRFYKETLTCINGAWQEQTLDCSSCFDAPSDGPHEWWTGIDEGSESINSFDCTYFASRPLQCAEFPEARAMCRISCRTCEEALMEFKVKAVRETKAGTKNPTKWIKKKLKVLTGFQNMVEDMRREKVPRRVKKN